MWGSESQFARWQRLTNGWFLTGDIGLIDRGGRLRLRGREREEINKGGMKIYPSDVDAVVERFEHTADVCTFAIPDEIYGQSVGLAVALKIHDDDTIRALHQWMKQHLADHKMPSRWWVVDTISRTSRGKINRENVSVICCAEPALDLPGLLSAK
jgi:acyl-CoA synthetase (AMP-forming)/AMP-acid ligase II